LPLRGRICRTIRGFHDLRDLCKNTALCRFNVSSDAPSAFDEARGLFGYPRLLDSATLYTRFSDIWGAVGRAKAKSGSTTHVDVRYDIAFKLYSITKKGFVRQDLANLDDTLVVIVGVGLVGDGNGPCIVRRQGPRDCSWCLDDHGRRRTRQSRILLLPNATLESATVWGQPRRNGRPRASCGTSANVFHGDKRPCSNFTCRPKSAQGTALYQTLQQPYFEKYLVEGNGRGAVARRAIRKFAGAMWSTGMRTQGDQGCCSTSIRPTAILPSLRRIG